MGDLVTLSAAKVKAAAMGIAHLADILQVVGIEGASEDARCLFDHHCSPGSI
ncbi:MAG: hypothetical protein JKX94_05405 [Sneathiella sp.]|nr:hypothetical protein [Sneathiella sp.]